MTPDFWQLLLTTRLKNFLMDWLLVLGLEEGLVECATLCVKKLGHTMLHRHKCNCMVLLRLRYSRLHYYRHICNMYVVPNQLEINNKFTDRSQKLLDSWTNKGQVDYSFHNDFWHIYFNFIANYVCKTRYLLWNFGYEHFQVIWLWHN